MIDIVVGFTDFVLWMYYRVEDSNSFTREANHNNEVPVSPLPNVSKPFETNRVALSSYRNGTVEVNGFHENGLSEVKKLSN